MQNWEIEVHRLIIGNIQESIIKEIITMFKDNSQHVNTSFSCC